MRWKQPSHSQFLGDLEEALEPKQSKILTRADYEAAIDRHQAQEKKELLERFEKGAKKYGPCDLTERDWIQNAHEEEIDRQAYVIFEIERRRRGL